MGVPSGAPRHARGPAWAFASMPNIIAASSSRVARRDIGHFPQDELMFGGQPRPLDDLQSTARIFDKSGAAFNPIPVIAIQNTIDQLGFRMMNMAANDAVQAASPRFPGQGVLETG